MYRADGPPSCAPVGETEFVNGVAAMSASGIYGRTRGLRRHRRPSPICASATRVEAVLEAHIAAGGGRFRGIRHSAAWDAIPTCSAAARRAAGPDSTADAEFRAGFARLAPARPVASTPGCYHPQLPGR